MKVFDKMDKEQADMYRWVRRNLNESMFWQLTGKPLNDTASVIDIDKELREAYLADRAESFAKRGVEASKIKIGVLPPALGKALLEYSEAYAESADFQEGLGGVTYAEMGREVTTKFLALCEEMAKLAR